MASPQLEKGYTKIANELLEATAGNITNSTWLRVVLLTIRLTYGWNRKEVQSNYGAYATKLHLTKETIRGAILEMADRKILKYLPITRESFIISICKNYELWKI